MLYDAGVDVFRDDKLGWSPPHARIGKLLGTAPPRCPCLPCETRCPCLLCETRCPCLPCEREGRLAPGSAWGLLSMGRAGSEERLWCRLSVEHQATPSTARCGPAFKPQAAALSRGDLAARSRGAGSVRGRRRARRHRHRRRVRRRPHGARATARAGGARRRAGLSAPWLGCAGDMTPAFTLVSSRQRVLVRPTIRTQKGDLTI